MADPAEVLQNVGQKMLSVPTDIMSVGTRRLTEDMGMMTAKVQELGGLMMPAGGLGLPQLPGLPGMGSEAAAAPPAQTRSEKTQGVRTTRKMSYLRV